MIAFKNIEAEMRCAHKGCPNKLGITVIGSLSGALTFDLPEGHGWQVAVQPTPLQEFVCRCPQHHEKLPPRREGLIKSLDTLSPADMRALKEGPKVNGS